jgi:hypothetical protein
MIDPYVEEWREKQDKIRDDFYKEYCSLKIKVQKKNFILNDLIEFDKNLKKHGFQSITNINEVYFEGSTMYSTAKIKYKYEDKRGKHDCYESFESTQSMVDFIKGFNQAVYTMT